MPERNHFLLHRCAEKFDKEAEIQTSRVVKTESYGEDEGVWMCWREMVDKLDVEKPKGKRITVRRQSSTRRVSRSTALTGTAGWANQPDESITSILTRTAKVESDQNRAAMEGERQLEDAEDRKEVEEQLENMVQAFGYNCSAPTQQLQQPRSHQRRRQQRSSR